MEDYFSANDIYFLQRALELAREAAKVGEVPVGAVIVDKDERFLAGAANACIRLNDPAAHAEILAIRAAAAKLGNYRLPECKLYVTLEPCVMCAGLCVHARLGEIIYAASDPKAGALHSRYRIGSDGLLNHNFTVRSGLLEKECSALLSEFFRLRRQKNEPPSEEGGICGNY